MRDIYKKILLFCFLIYFFCVSLKIIELFIPIQLLTSNIFIIEPSSLRFGSLILFIYVGIKGNKIISKIGIGSIIVSLLIPIIYSIIKYNYYGYIPDNINYISKSVVDIFEFLAIFSLFKNHNFTRKYEIMSVLCVVLKLLAMIAICFFKSSTLDLVGESLEYLSELIKYFAIVFYLVGSNDTSEQISMTSELALNDTEQAMNQNDLEQINNQTLQEQTINQDSQVTQ